MKSRIINSGEQRTFVVVFDSGDEVIKGLSDFARGHQISAAEFAGIGALSDLVLGYFDWQQKSYRRIPLAEQVEVVSLLGNIARGEDGAPTLHPHIIVAKSDGSAHGGHLLEAHVRPTLEIVVTESPAYLQRRHDPQSGLALIRL
ncbi:MAG TPA: PPC domain-containing DNA-binding protein [Stellaceae bacterium]|nr:PPC domain-containing DNA-binding protein [Stellaceae bacterium]